MPQERNSAVATTAVATIFMLWGSYSKIGTLFQESNSIYIRVQFYKYPNSREINIAEQTQRRINAITSIKLIEVGSYYYVSTNNLAFTYHVTKDRSYTGDLGRRRRERTHQYKKYLNPSVTGMNTSIS